MGIRDDNPALLWHVNHFFAFVAYFLFFSLNKAAGISGIFQDSLYGIGTPDILFFLGFIGEGGAEGEALRSFMHGWGGNAALGQMGGDGSNAIAFLIHGKNPFHNGGCIIIHHQPVTVEGGFGISITGKGTNELAVFHFFCAARRGYCPTDPHNTIH